MPQKDVLPCVDENRRAGPLDHRPAQPVGWQLDRFSLNSTTDFRYRVTHWSPKFLSINSLLEMYAWQDTWRYIPNGTHPKVTYWLSHNHSAIGDLKVRSFPATINRLCFALDYLSFPNICDVCAIAIILTSYCWLPNEPHVPLKPPA